MAIGGGAKDFRKKKKLHRRGQTRREVFWEDLSRAQAGGGESFAEKIARPRMRLEKNGAKAGRRGEPAARGED